MDDEIRTDYAVGDFAIFKNYSDVDEDFKPVLTAGQKLRVMELVSDGSLVVAVVEDGVVTKTMDSVFPDEITWLSIASENGAEVNVTAAFSLDEGMSSVSIAVVEEPEETLEEPLDEPSADDGDDDASDDSDPDGDPVELTAEETIGSTPVGNEAPSVEEAVRAVLGRDLVPAAEVQPIPPAPAPRSTLTVLYQDTGLVVPLPDSEQVSNALEHLDALEAAKALARQGNETYFTLGGVLAHVYYEEIYRRIGYDHKAGFAEYVDKELGVEYRRAMYLIDIYVTFRNLGIDENRLIQMGWSKAKELTRYINPDNAERLIELANTSTRDELTASLKSEAPAVILPSKKRYTFSLHPDQNDVVSRALDYAKTILRNDNPNLALESICAEWTNMTEGVELPLDAAIRALEVRYGVRVSVLT